MHLKDADGMTNDADLDLIWVCTGFWPFFKEKVPLGREDKIFIEHLRLVNSCPTVYSSVLVGQKAIYQQKLNHFLIT